MAIFSVKDADKYGGQGGGGYFSLKEDREVGKVRILLDTIDDVNGYSVHQIEVNGKKRYVNCLHEYGNSKDDCPFCAAGKFAQVKYFIPVYNMNEERVQIWERGKSFKPEIESTAARYPHLYQRVSEIERLGKKGDTKTSYKIYPGEIDEDVYLEDFDITNPMGTIILDKSAEDMTYFLKRGEFPDSEVSERPSRGTSRDSYDERPSRDSYEDDRPRRSSGAGRDRF